MAHDVTSFINQISSTVKGYAVSNDLKKRGYAQLTLDTKDLERISLVILRELILEDIVRNDHFLSMFTRNEVCQYADLEIKNLNFNALVTTNSSLVDESSLLGLNATAIASASVSSISEESSEGDFDVWAAALFQIYKSVLEQFFKNYKESNLFGISKCTKMTNQLETWAKNIVTSRTKKKSFEVSHSEQQRRYYQQTFAAKQHHRIAAFNVLMTLLRAGVIQFDENNKRNLKHD